MQTSLPVHRVPSLRNKHVEIQFGKSVCCKDFTSCKPKVGQKDEGCAVVITSLSALKQIFKDYYVVLNENFLGFFQC